MRGKKKAYFAVEALEARINFSGSVLGGALAAPEPMVAAVDGGDAALGVLSDVRRYRVDALSTTEPAGTGTNSGSGNILNPAAQSFFNRFISVFHSPAPVAGVPSVGGLVVNPTSVAVGTSVVVTASNVVQSHGTISGVAFYRSTNYVPGHLSSGDVYLGNGTVGSNAGSWTLTSGTSGLSAGTFTYYAIATGTGSLKSGAVAATLAVTARPTQSVPVIGSFTVSPGTVTAGGIVSLVISNVSSASSTISGVAIYRETNSTSGLQSSDTFVGNASHGATAWSLNISTTGYAAGNYTFYAVATDAGHLSSVAAVGSLTVTAVPAPAPTNPVGVVARSLTSFTQLVITGTTGNDSIVVSQSGSTITVVGNGGTQTFTGTFGQIEVVSNGGNDTITINSSVNISTLIYGSTGNGTILDLGTGINTIVTLGGGTNTVTGNGVSTMYWANTRDTMHASAGEIAAGDVHTVAGFYQPYTTSSTAAGYVPITLNSPALRDPTAATTTTKRLTSNSLWGTGPTLADVNQGQAADCYYLATIQSLAFASPSRLENTAVDLGDGTYAVEFMRNGAAAYVRVDGDLATTSGGGLLYARPGVSGDLWAPIMEKAYAYFRTGANTYASLDWGWTGSAMDDLGMANNMISLSGNAAALYQTLSTALAGHKAIAVITNTSIAGGAPLVGSHAYSLIGASYSGGVYTFTVRNPWGVDGAGSDSNPSDGIVQLTLAQLQANIQWGSVAV